MGSDYEVQDFSGIENILVALKALSACAKVKKLERWGGKRHLDFFLPLLSQYGHPTSRWLKKEQQPQMMLTH